MRNSVYTPLLTEPYTFVSALKSKIFNIVKASRILDVENHKRTSERRYDRINRTSPFNNLRVSVFRRHIAP